MALVHGVDLVEVERIKAMLADHGSRFVERVFTSIEQRDAEAGGRRRAEHYAARFAAKEAVFKALGTGWSGGIDWRDVSVVRLPGGQPTVCINGAAASAAKAKGIEAWALSLTHTSTHAMASVVGSEGTV